MTVTTKPLLALTAADLMSAPVRTIPQHMPLREAARLLAREQIGGPPVPAPAGRCVGMLSATDFLRRVAEAAAPTEGGPADWDRVDVEGLPEEQVGEHMTADLVVVAAD